MQPKAGSTLDASSVIAWVQQHLADYKKPRFVELVEELPRDPNGKVVKRKLRNDYIASLAALSSSEP